MGKHVLIEIPMGMSLAESERLAALEEQADGRLVCMVCHSQRYSRSFREIKRRRVAGELNLHHIVQQIVLLFHLHLLVLLRLNSYKLIPLQEEQAV